MRANEITMPPCTGTAPPQSPVPAPRGTSGSPQFARDADDRADVLRIARDHGRARQLLFAERVVGVRSEIFRLRFHRVAADRIDEACVKRRAPTGIGLHRWFLARAHAVP